MSPRSKEANEHIRRESEGKIVMASIELFANYGYQNVSISQIAKKAKVSQGLLYHYFKNKEELLEKVISKIFQQLDRFMDTENASTSPKKRLKEIIEMFFTVLKQQKSFWLLAFPLITQPSLSPVIKGAFNQYFSFLVKELQELFMELEFKNPKIEAYKLGATFDGLALDYLFIVPDCFPIEEMKESLLKQYQLL